MLSTLAVVLPIFALVLAGWTAHRIGVLGPGATSELNRFVVYLALPALLLDVTAHARGADLWQPGFIAAFGGSSLGIFVVTVLLRLQRMPLADAAIDGLNAGYPNTGFMGFPLALAALGPAALSLTTVAVILTVCVTFGVAIVLIETGLQARAGRGRVAAKVARSLGRNPLLVAPVLGAMVPLAGWSLPAPCDAFLKLLGGAASPCALVALGLFLAARRDPGPAGAGPTVLLAALKLAGQPLLAWLIARSCGLAPLATHAAVLLAALPTGTGPFMLAEFYGREAAITGRVILLSTVLSVLTVAGYLAAAT